MAMIRQHQPIASLINRITLQLIRWSFQPHKSIGNHQQPPVLISGIFRSGTSLTASILAQAGYDLGPEHHLMQSRPNYPHNPDGFKENYFLMEVSMLLFKLSGASGDKPPSEHLIENVDPNSLSDDELRTHSLLCTHDDRVNNLNKLRVLRKSSVHSIRGYISNTFGECPLIKNPHFSVLEPFFQKIFPDSTRIVVFRNPADWLLSARAVTPNADYRLYDRYYEYYLSNLNSQFVFFDYDRLLAKPEESIRALLDKLGRKSNDIASLTRLIRFKKQIGATKNPTSFPANYRRLAQLAVNR